MGKLPTVYVVLPIAGLLSTSTTLGFSHSACGLKTSVIFTLSVSFDLSLVLLTICNLVKMSASLNCSSSSHHGNGHNTAPL